MEMRTSDLLLAKLTPIKPARMTHSYRMSCKLVNKLHSTGICKNSCDVNGYAAALVWRRLKYVMLHFSL